MASSEYGTEGRGRGADLHHAGSAQIAMASPSQSRDLRKNGEIQKNRKITKTSTNGGEQDKRAAPTVTATAAAANNSATATAAQQRENQRALDDERKERSTHRKGGIMA